VIGETVALSSADGFIFPAVHLSPREARRGGLVILAALWGVTPHIRALAATFAEEGWEVLAPSLLERWDPGFAVRDVEPERRQRRQVAAEAAGWGRDCWRDIQAAVNRLAPPVCVMGFCFGGTAAWSAACRCDGLAAAACFYGGHILQDLAETPKCPTVLHFGRHDPLIPLAAVQAIEAAHPDLPIWLYYAGHAFVAPSDHHPESARLALLRTRQHFHRTISAKEAGA
jgi:carboxymethylenebutenolidase